MKFRLEPQISRPKRQSAAEQTADLLKAYLEHRPDPFETMGRFLSGDVSAQNESDLTAGFILPTRRSA